MLKHYSLFILLSIFSVSGCATTALWHCTATNANGAVWNWFGVNHDETSKEANRSCSTFNNHQLCEVICFPPKVYWRCVSHDTPPVLTPSEEAKPANNYIKQGSWYWVSYSKQIAMNGARDACRHNSAFGGCYSKPDDCGSS